MISFFLCSIEAVVFNCGNILSFNNIGPLGSIIPDLGPPSIKRFFSLISSGSLLRKHAMCSIMFSMVARASTKPAKYIKILLYCGEEKIITILMLKEKYETKD